MLIVPVIRGDDRDGIKMRARKDGVPIDLTGCTVKFYMPPKVPEAFCTVLDAEEGIISLPIETSIVDELGEFQFQIKIFWPDGRKKTLPDEFRAVLQVLPDLAGGES